MRDEPIPLTLTVPQAGKRYFNLERGASYAAAAAGHIPIISLAKRHDVSRNLIRIWVRKYEEGSFDDDAQAADLIQGYEAGLLRWSGLSASRLWNWSTKGGSEKRPAAEKRNYIRHHRPRRIALRKGAG